MLAPTVVNHYQLKRIIDVYVAPKKEELGAVAAQVNSIISIPTSRKPAFSLDPSHNATAHRSHWLTRCCTQAQTGLSIRASAAPQAPALRASAQPWCSILAAARSIASRSEPEQTRYLLSRSFIHFEQLKTINDTDIITNGQNEERRRHTINPEKGRPSRSGRQKEKSTAAAIGMDVICFGCSPRVGSSPPFPLPRSCGSKHITSCQV